MQLESLVCALENEINLQGKNMTKKVITEEMNEHEKWYENCKKQTLQTLPEFLNNIANNYEHDYGTICHAIAASAIAAASAINGCPQGGITGFQAGAVMWIFIEKWMNEDGAMKLIKYNEMLYPQYQEKFEKIICSDVHQSLISKAKDLLSKNEKSQVSDKVWQHWLDVSNGHVPFGYIVKNDDE